MSYTSLLRNGTFVILASMLSLTACKREKKDNTTVSTTLTDADDNGGYASDAARLEQYGNDVLSIADIAGTTGSANMRTTSTCATVTNDTISSPRKLTINFGTTNCLCVDGKYRRGSIVVTYTGRYKDSGATHTITSNNYYVNDFKFNIHKTVTNKGTNMSGNVWYEVTVNDSLVLGTDSIISWTGNRTRTWLAGYATTDRSDDVYEIGGVTTLTRASGRVFTHTITTPLKIATSCAYIQSGVVTVSSTSFVGGSRTLDYSYGGGGCDNQAQLTIGSRTYVIVLR